MHSRTLSFDIHCNHHGDYSGDVEFILPINRVKLAQGRYEVQIPFADLQTLVADQIRAEVIRRFEQMNAQQLIRHYFSP